MDCSICTASNLQELEVLGLAALRGESSWREAARQGGLTHGQALKNHMQRHYVAHQEGATVEGIEAEFDRLTAEAVSDLQDAMAIAPADTKPLFAIAIHNLLRLKDTNPSQQALTNALKAIHEIQGLKQEQRLLLEMSRHYDVLDVAEAPKELEA